MKKYVYPLLLALLMPVVLVSCLSDEEEAEYDNHCYISSFTLGTLKRTLYMKSSENTDSAYTTTFAGSLFPMTINQRTLTIENLDSLPLRTRVSAALATVSFQGSLAWRKADLTGAEDTTWTAYSSSDSLDFSEPLHFATVASDGKSHRIYTVKVNVHRQKADSTEWTALGETATLAGLGERKTICWRDMLVVLAENAAGASDGLTYVQHPLQTAGEWMSLSTTGTADAVLSTLQQRGNTLYMSTTAGQIIQSTNAVDWTPGSYPVQEGLQLVGASDNRLYALLDGKLVSSDGGTWEEERLDDEADRLPIRQVATFDYRLPNGQQRMLLIGTDGTNSEPRLWAKAWAEGKESEETWMYYVPNGADKYALPILEQLNVVAYDNGFLAFGGASADGSLTAMETVLYSQDHGITWRPYADDDMNIDPAIQEAAGQATYISSTADEDNYLWVVVDNNVWRGRINRLGFLRQDP